MEPGKKREKGKKHLYAETRKPTGTRKTVFLDRKETETGKMPNAIWINARNE